MRQFKIYENEIKAIVALIEAGYLFVLVCESVPHITELKTDGKSAAELLEEYGSYGWAHTWGLDNSTIFQSNNVEEIKSFFEKPFEAIYPKIIVSPGGTHCGNFEMILGWVHSQKVKKEDLEEAVMPQQ